MDNALFIVEIFDAENWSANLLITKKFTHGWERGTWRKLDQVAEN